MSNATRSPLAIVGVSALFPGSSDATGFWHDILEGRDLLTDIPKSHWLVEDYYDPDPKARDKTYARRGGFIDPVDFDAATWGIPPTILKATDTSQLLGLIVAERVLRDASRDRFDSIDRSRISVILGVTSAQELLASMVSRLQRPVWVKSLREQGLPEDEVQAACDRIADHYVEWEESSFPGLLGNVVAGRIANRLDLGGTNCVTDAACASTFSALSMAAQELYLGDSDLVITGGVDTLNEIFMFMCFSKTPAISLTGDCRPFSDEADGTMLGEGLGMVALRRLEDAERDGDRIYAVVRGIGSSSDGRSKSVYAPVSSGQALALRRAYERAGYGPETVELVEAHGTGTKAGDAAELGGLSMVFDAPDSESRQWCALGSVKSQIGHTKAAAGAAGLFKAVMALHHKVLPPTIKVERPNPSLDFESSAFYVNTKARPWVRGDDHPRRAGVSAFGFGGSNFHVALEEYQGPAPRAERMRTLETELVVLGGEDVVASARHWAGRADEVGIVPHAAWATQHAYDPGAPRRLAVVVATPEELRERLERAATRIEADPETPFELPDGTHYGVGARSGGVALLFPGQGSQYVGMGAELAMAFDCVQAAWDRAASLSFEVFPIPRFSDEEREADEERLRATQWAQPAIGCASAAMLALVQRLGIEPQAVAGHSFGEITALFAAGALAEADLLAVAGRRGELMAQAGVDGAMTAVSASVDEVRQVLDAIDDVVLANHNGPRQVVLSGPLAAIEQAEAALKSRDLRCSRLRVSTAFHSPVVAASVEPFTRFLEGVELGPAAVPVYSAETATIYEAGASAQRARLARQIAEPVRFVDTIGAMAEAGIHTFVEVGPSSVLTGLVGRILESRPHAAVAFDRKGRGGVQSLMLALAKLAALGVPMDLSALWEGYREPIDPASRIRPKMAIALSGANHGKLYPPPGGAADLPAPNPPRATMSRAPKPTSSPDPRSAPALAPAAPPDGWLAAWQQAQQQTAHTQALFQQTMAESHAAYLRTTQTSLMGLAAMAGVSMPASELAAQPLAEAPLAPAMPVATVPPAVEAPTPMATAPAVSPPPAPAIAPATPSVDLEALMLEVVADKTGYPQDMLELSMDMEAELGIDSIKRVEILAAVQESAPGMPPVDASHMGTLKTLGEIVEYMRSRLEGASPSASPSSQPSVDVDLDVDLEALMLEVVAEKTGYPQDMLELSMDMEAELGIDSIKRVEILAAVQERAPGMPPVDASHMGTLKTLGEIVDYMRGLLEGTSAPAEQASAPETKDTIEIEPPPLGRYALEIVDAPAAGLALAGLFAPGGVFITSEGGPVAPALVAELERRGVRAQLHDTPPSTASAVIFLGGLRAVSSEAEAIAINREAFALARGIAPRLSTEGGLLVTVQDTGGGFGLEPCPPVRAYLGGIPALTKTARQEWPTASLKSIDIAVGDRSAEAIAAAIADELLFGGGEIEVALSASGERRTLRSFASEVVPGEPVIGPLIGPGDVVVVSGGARGVTAACVRTWASQCGARFVLLGRTALDPEPEGVEGVEDDAGLKRVLLERAQARGEKITPAALSRQVGAIASGREIQATLAALRAMEVEARYVSVDVTDAPALTEALAEVRASWGPVTALVHAAGVLADKPIAALDDAAFDRVFDTKVGGLQALLQATQSDPLRLLALFSSVSARCGNNGQSAYAMANEVLNKVAQAKARDSRMLVKSFGWGPWEGGMVSPALRERFAALGVPMIPLSVGAEMLADELRGSNRAQVELCLGGEPRPEALLVSGSEVRRLELSVHLHRDTHGYLADHSINGTAVVPVVLALEWMTRLARAFRPDLHLRSIEGLRVLRGIKLTHFEEEGHRFTLRCQPKSDSDGSRLSLEVLGTDGTPHFRAEAIMSAREPDSEVPKLPSSPLRAWNGSPVYGDVLFHGQRFQVIESLEGVGPQSIVGTLSGVERAGWNQERWQTDVAAHDGGLQLAVLWARESLGRAMLPMGVEALRLPERPLARGSVRCVAQCREAGDSRVLADLVFLDDEGQLVSELHGAELVVRPDMPSIPGT